jgi:hypothetical protein
MSKDESIVDNNMLLETISKIQYDIYSRNIKDREILRKRYIVFFRQYPSLFDLIVESPDISYMPMLLDMIKKAHIVNKEPNKREEIEKEIGEILNTKYINPIIEKLEEENANKK